MRSLLLAAVAMAFSTSAFADQPTMAPTRPVIVTYQLSGSSRIQDATKVRVTYDHDARRVRLDFYRFVESPESYPEGSLIFDKPADRVVTLITGSKAYLQRDAVGLANPGLMLSPSLQYVRGGTEQFAGFSCTDWSVKNGKSTGDVCVTDDGVVLRADRGAPQPGRMRAIAITYAIPPIDAFAIPSNFHRMDPATHR